MEKDILLAVENTYMAAACLNTGGMVNAYEGDADMEEHTTKRCSSCRQTKSHDDFYKNRSNKDGLNWQCKECFFLYCKANRENREAYRCEWRRANPDKVKAMCQKYYQANREKKLVYGREYRQVNREKIAVYNHEWYEANRENALKQGREYRRLNPEKEAARHQKYALSNRERLAAARRNWAKANPNKMKVFAFKYRQANQKKRQARQAVWRRNNPTYHRDYRKAYPEKANAENHRRRAYKLALPPELNTFTAQEWREILNAYGYRCAYCGKKETKSRKMTLDHVIALSQGGAHTKENVVPACGSCNSRKGPREAPAFQRSLIL